jgi:mevalonate kinase
MKFRMSAPSKTFLTGEYAVMVGGPALLLNTGPRFKFSADHTGTSEAVITGIPAGSPADTWLKQRAPLLEGWKLSFEDPHGGRGGFGASGAQFLFVHAFTTSLQFSKRIPKFELKSIFNDYQVCARGSGSGGRHSCAVRRRSFSR